VRGVLGDLDDIVKNVAFRDLSAALACTVGIGSDVWMPSRELLVLANCTLPRRPRRRARPATPGDLLLHIRANRRDLCFELERQLLDRFGDAVAVADETVGFRYFDARDLLGFVDGTANPVGAALPAADDHRREDPAGSGGSYLVVQKYVHALTGWKELSTEQQEAVIGRTKSDNIELDDAARPTRSRTRPLHDRRRRGPRARHPA
jgi:putative iron-dependent peroxidase